MLKIDERRNERDGYPANVRRCVRVIKAEYAEMPGLQLTKEQMYRLFGCDIASCESAVCVLEEAKFLRRTTHGAFVRADLGA